ncbi:MAG: DUF1801 domain-containing protein [Promethearchaeota archaeon]
MDNKVTEYIEKQKYPQKDICQKLREIIIKAFPAIEEKMKYGVPYYEDKYYIVALKNHVNLGVSIKNLNIEEIKLFEGTGKTTRHLKLNSIEEIDQQKIVRLLKLIK